MNLAGETVPTPLGEVVRFGNGKAIKPGGTGRYPVYGSNGIIGGSDDFRHENGVIIGRVGAYCGSVAYCPTPFWASDNTLVAYPASEEIDTRFLYYLLGSANLRNYAGGAAQPLVTQTVLKQVEVAVPDLPTQRRIAGILSAYDDLIENNLRRIKILEEMAQSLYREWFVHFRFPGHDGSSPSGRGRGEGAKSIPLVDSPLGPIPDGWEVKTIDETAIVHRGRSYRSNELVEDGGVPFVNLKCIARDGGFRRDGIKFYDGPFKEPQQVRSGDIVMAVTDMTQERRIVARAARVPDLEGGFGVISMDLVRIEARLPELSDFLYSYFRCSDFADHLKQFANGANVLHLSPDKIRDHCFAMPVLPVASQYVEVVSAKFAEIENLHQRNDILRQTRDLLLPKLISSDSGNLS